MTEMGKLPPNLSYAKGCEYSLRLFWISLRYGSQCWL